jgi:hypothetical protein
MKAFGINMENNDTIISNQGREKGLAQGVWGDLNTGSTRVMAGEALKVSDNGSFAVYSNGTWLETSKFLSLADSNPTLLASLGYPTQALSYQTTLNGSVNSYGYPPYYQIYSGNVSLNNRFFTYADSTIDPGKDHLVWASTVSGNYSVYPPSTFYTVFSNSVFISNSDSSYPFYGTFTVKSTTSSNWLAEISFSGTLPDDQGNPLAKNFYGVGAGTYGDGQFSGYAAGLNKTLAFMNSVGVEAPNYAWLSYYDPQSASLRNEGRLFGVMGGASSLWQATTQQPATIDLVGLFVGGPADGKLSASTQGFETEILSRNALNGKAVTADGGAYWGTINGVNQVNGPAGSKGSLSGLIAGIYIDPSNKAGIMRGQFDGVLDTVNKGWSAQGTIMTSLMSSTAIAPADLPNNIVRSALSSGLVEVNFDPASSPASSQFSASMANLNDSKNKDWGVWNTSLSANVNLNGADLNNPSNLNGSWQYTEKDANNTITKIVAAQTNNNTISSGVVQGTTVGYYGDGTSGTTGILVGDSRTASEPGRFDPWKTTLQMAQAGLWLDSNKLAANLATDEGKKRLKELNVPVAEIGRATMTGAWSAGTSSMNVTMKDMVFLAPNTGDRPSIWSTGNVGGSYTGNPLGASVPLSGGGANLSGLNANFKVQQWNTTSNTWLSTVTNGSGTYTNFIPKPGNGLPTSVPLSFQGAAAGAIAPGKTGGTFSGTGAGIAK